MLGSYYGNRGDSDYGRYHQDQDQYRQGGQSQYGYGQQQQGAHYSNRDHRGSDDYNRPSGDRMFSDRDWRDDKTQFGGGISYGGGSSNFALGHDQQRGQYSSGYNRDSDWHRSNQGSSGYGGGYGQGSNYNQGQSGRNNYNDDRDRSDRYGGSYGARDTGYGGGYGYGGGQGRGGESGIGGGYGGNYGQNRYQSSWR